MPTSIQSRGIADNNDGRFTFAAPKNWLKGLRAFAQNDPRFKGNVSGALKAGADLLMSEDKRRKPTEISFDLNEADQKALVKLADDLRLDDPNQFAKSVIRHAIDYGPELMREFVSGGLNQTLAESKSKSDFMKRVGAEVEKEKAQIAARKNRTTKSTEERKAA